MKRILPIVIFLALILTACSAAAPQATGSFDLNNWPSVLAAARGQTINWYIWGGSDSINQFVDEFYGKALKDQYGITLNRIPVADTVDAVNQVLSEKQAGKDPGAVDLIWINGENFFTLKQANLLYPDWAQTTPQQPVRQLGKSGHQSRLWHAGG